MMKLADLVEHVKTLPPPPPPPPPGFFDILTAPIRFIWKLTEEH